MTEKGPTVITLRDGIYLDYKPSEAEIGSHLTFSSGPLVKDLVTSFSENRKRVKLSLKSFPDQVPSDLIPDRISLSLVYLHTQYDKYLKRKALMVFNKPSDFVFWTDFKYGFDMILGTLAASQSPKSHEQHMIKQMATEAQIWPQAKWEQPQKMKDAKDEAQYWSKELINDPSGFKLVSRVVDELKHGVEIEGLPRRVTYEIPEYVAAGADLAARLYKLCYPLTEGILKTVKKD